MADVGQSADTHPFTMQTHRHATLDTSENLKSTLLSGIIKINQPRDLANIAAKSRTCSIGPFGY